MPRPLAILLLLSVVAQIGCGSNDEPPARVALGDACAASEGTRVVVDGYLRLPMRVSVSDRAVIDLFAERGGRGDHVNLELAIGTAPNQMEDVPERYSVTSLRVAASDGSTVTINTHVELTASVAKEEAPGADGCVLRDPQIMRSPERPSSQ